MNQFRSPPEIDELPELTWRRIEKGLFESLDDQAPQPTEVMQVEGKRRWPLIAAAVSCAAAVALFVALRPSSKGDPDALRTSRIVTSEASSKLSIGDASITVEPESAIWIASQGERIEIVLERGSVDCAVAARPDRPPFVVRAGDVRIEVIGTEFAVTRDGDSAHVEVYEGVVRVVDDGSLHRVSAGESWPAGIVEPGVDDEDATELPPRRDRASARDRHDQAGDGERERSRRHGARPGSTPDDTTAAPSDRELYETAARLEARDADAAVAIYRRLAAGAGPWSATALFAQARLESERGHHRAAARLLGRYLERYPDGSNADDARLLLNDLEN